MSTTQQPEALRLADALAYCDASVASQAAAELRRQHAALSEWFEKTEWARKTTQPHELGKHYADVLRERIEKLQADNETLRTGYAAARLEIESLRALAGVVPAPRSVTEPTQVELDAFILRAGFRPGWENLESWARRMAEQAVREINEARAMRAAQPASSDDARKLATAIAEAATRAGITNASEHSFSGPQLLMLLDDIVEMIERARAAQTARAQQPAIMPKGDSAAAQLRAMATNYPAGHLWDKLDAKACIRGALEIEALRASHGQAPAQAAPTTDSYVQPVPDKCDRITWRGSYYHLPLKAPQQPVPAPAAVEGPSDHELDSLIQKFFGWMHTIPEGTHRAFAREVLAQFGAAPTTQPAPQQEPTCKENLQVQVWVIPDGAGGGQFSWAPQDERYWTKLTAQPAPQQEPTSVDLKTMELAESVGLIGPASRTHDLHAAIQRFHDLICANATIKAAQMAAEVISKAAPQPSPASQEGKK